MVVRSAGISADGELPLVGFAWNSGGCFITTDPFPSDLSLWFSCLSVNPWALALNFVGVERERALNPGIMISPVLYLGGYYLYPTSRHACALFDKGMVL
jgi:hypothetical protein